MAEIFQSADIIGRAEASVEPDHIVFSVRATVRHTEQDEAQHAIENAMSLVAALCGDGTHDTGVRSYVPHGTNFFATTQQSDGEDTVFFHGTSRATVRLGSDIETASLLFSALASIKHVAIPHIGYEVDHDSPERLALCAAAFRSARQRAEAYAEGSGSRVLGWQLIDETAAGETHPQQMRSFRDVIAGSAGSAGSDRNDDVKLFPGRVLQQISHSIVVSFAFTPDLAQ